MIPKVDCDNGPRPTLGRAVVDGPEVCYRPMADNLHDSARPHAHSADVDQLSTEGVMADGGDRKSFATKLRIITLLSLVCWAALIAGIIWLVP